MIDMDVFHCHFFGIVTYFILGEMSEWENIKYVFMRYVRMRKSL